MTDDSSNPPAKPAKKRPPLKRGAGGKGAGLKLPPFLAKIPLPYLGGGAAAMVMVAFVVIKAVMVPVPVAGPQTPPSASSPSEVQGQPPVAQPQDQPPAPTSGTSGTSASTPAPAQQQPSAAPAVSSPTDPGTAVPAYGGPRGGAVMSADSDLPMMLPYGDALKELGRRVRMDLSAFEDQTTLYETPDMADGAIPGFGFRLPKDWISVGRTGVAVGSDFSQTVVAYAAPATGGARSFFNIQVQKMPFLAQIRDMMALRAKNDLLTYQALSIYGQNRGEAIYVTTRENISYVVRCVSVISGTRMVTAEFGVPSDQYEALQDIQTWVITRFYLATVDETPAEPIKTADFLDLGSFDYPSSWVNQVTDVKSLDRMRVSLLNPESSPSNTENTNRDGTVLKGQVDAMMFSHDAANSEARMLASMNSLFTGQGVYLGEPSGRFDMGVFPGFDVVFARTYPLINGQGVEQPYQYWLIELQGKKRSYMVGLLSPSRDQDFALWTRNFAAFRYVVQTIKE